MGPGFAKKQMENRQLCYEVVAPSSSFSLKLVKVGPKPPKQGQVCPQKLAMNSKKLGLGPRTRNNLSQKLMEMRVMCYEVGHP